MARYGNICLGPADNKVSQQSKDDLATVAITPGSICTQGTAGFALFGTDGGGAGVRLFIANYNYFRGLDSGDANPSGGTMEGLIPFDDGEYAVLIADGQNVTAINTPLTAATGGALRIGTPGTDDILYYANEVFNNNTGGAELIRAVKA